MARFEYLRISLARHEMPLLDGRVGLDRLEIRENFFKEILSRRWDFQYRSHACSFVPIESDDPMIMLGFIGRHVSEDGHEGPDKGYEPTVREDWGTAIFALDLNDERQIAVVEHQPKVGNPKGVVAALFSHITSVSPYMMWDSFIENLTSKQDFWDAANKHKGNITLIRFEFFPPNMLKGKEAVDGLIKAAHEDANSETTELALKNPDGKLKPSGEVVETSVERVRAGVATGIMKSGKKVIYRSQKSKVIEAVNKADVPATNDKKGVLDFAKSLLKKR